MIELEVTEEIEHEIIEIRRVSKVVKGGRNLSFRVIVVIGDKNGHVGIGKGNTTEIPLAIQQAIRAAKLNMIEVPLKNGTIPHAVIGKFKASEVILKPAYPGTGIIAGNTVGAICRMAGILDILTKSLGSNNPLTLSKATIEGLKKLLTPQKVAELRDKKVEDVYT